MRERAGGRAGWMVEWSEGEKGVRAGLMGDWGEQERREQDWMDWGVG